MPHRRWRVRDNMPGTRYICPVIRKTDETLKMMALDVPGLIHQLALEFGDELLMRSAVWMTLRESKSSFAIEGEADQQTRIGRFADVLARRCGQGALPLDQITLAQLHRRSEMLSVFAGEVWGGHRDCDVCIFLCIQSRTWNLLATR